MPPTELNNAQYENEKGELSYEHRFHAGNIGDVWKHAVLISLLKSCKSSPDSFSFIECHAGAGIYSLQSTGEWSEGIGRLAAAQIAKPAAGLSTLLEFVRARNELFPTIKNYPGSPLIVSKLLRAADRMIAYETNPMVYQQLCSALSGAANCELVHADGIEALARIASQHSNPVIHIDPPWNVKKDWDNFPAVVLAVIEQSPKARVALWYPIKSYTRINAMLKRLIEAKLAFTTLELLTTPIEYQRNRLNGSGMLLVNAPSDVIEECSLIGAQIAPHCATRHYWECRVHSRF